jgi:hypothetical protein
LAQQLALQQQAQQAQLAQLQAQQAQQKPNPFEQLEVNGRERRSNSRTPFDPTPFD